MKNPVVMVLLKALGTAGLAFGFIVLVGSVPFMPQTTDSRSNANRAHAVAGSGGAVPRVAASALSSRRAVVAPDEPVSVTGAPGMATGLFEAHFAGNASGPGFTTEEHRVPGPCEGAGRRYLDKACPHCRLIPGSGEAASPAMLMWTEANALHAVSADCTSLAADGVPIVGTLVMNDPTVDLGAGGSDFASDVIPLLPGARRMASVEIGGWMAVFDQVARPSTALADMAAALVKRGWRETADPDAAGLATFEDQRVFTKSTDIFCVISLGKQGGNYQLLTVVSSGARG